jgi:hypothetical protein
MPALNISAEHPDAENRLLGTCGLALQSLGAEVTVCSGADNALRLVAPAERVRTFAARAPAALPPGPVVRAPEGEKLAVIEVEGLPNLLHELVHVALAGALADDHGYDYGAIPYDLASVRGRAVLWEEIACCVVSCAYLDQPGAAGRAIVDSWFDEQLGIQPVFYGMEHDPAAFFATVDGLVHAHIGELVAMLDCAYERVERLLAPFRDGRAPERLAFAPLWSRWWSRRRAAALASGDEVAA